MGVHFRIGRGAQARLLTSIGGRGDAPLSLAAYRWWCQQTSSNATPFTAEAAQICAVHDARDLPAQIRLPERELGPRIRVRVRGLGANGVHELVRKPLVNMS